MKFLSDARQLEVAFFPILGRHFDQIFKRIVSMREKTLKNANLVVLRHIKRENPSPPVTYVPQKCLCLSSGTFLMVQTNKTGK